MRVRGSLFAKILFWFFLNVVALVALVFGLATLQYRLPSSSVLFLGNRLDAVAAIIIDEMQAGGDRDAILARHAREYHVEFLLFAHDGRRIAGADIDVPKEVRGYVAGPLPPPPPPPPPPAVPPGDRSEARPPAGSTPDQLPAVRRSDGGLLAGPALPPKRLRSVFTVRTTNPTRYWAGVRLPVFEAGRDRPELATLLASSDSISGHGLFFSITSWLLAAGAVLGVSILLWVPFIRGLTTSLREMTVATERIADEHFEVEVDEKRSDEVGRLGVAVNHLSRRLARFVGGQKRFLGAIAHELNSPLGRMQVALGILEERVDESCRPYVADAQEEVASMSRLVSELLAFSRAGMTRRELPLAPLPLLTLVEEVRRREAPDSDVRVSIADDIAVLGHATLLSRALANVVRNANRYAGQAGPIRITATRDGDRVVVEVADQGPGVPADAIERLFDPFFRLEPDRARSTGGSGLGLTIVRTCVEACQGSVAAHNTSPGLSLTITLRSA